MECTLLREEPGGAEYTTVAIEHKKDAAALAAVLEALKMGSLEPAARIVSAAPVRVLPRAGVVMAALTTAFNPPPPPHPTRAGETAPPSSAVTCHAATVARSTPIHPRGPFAPRHAATAVIRHLPCVWGDGRGATRTSSAGPSATRPSSSRWRAGWARRSEGGAAAPLGGARRGREAGGGAVEVCRHDEAEEQLR